MWLDPERTSPFEFYQFWLNTDDRDVVSYLKYFTFLERDRIDELERATHTAPERRDAQRVLASDVTARVHGEDEEEKARRASQQLFSGNPFALPVQDLLATLGDAPSTTITLQELREQRPITRWLVDTRMVASRSEATRLIRSGGIYLNDERVKDEKRRLGVSDLWNGVLAVLGKGQRQKHVLRLGATNNDAPNE